MGGGNMAVIAPRVAHFNPNQPRDKDGKWTDGPVGSNAAPSTPKLSNKGFLAALSSSQNAKNAQASNKSVLAGIAAKQNAAKAAANVQAAKAEGTARPGKPTATPGADPGKSNAELFAPRLREDDDLRSGRPPYWRTGRAPVERTETKITGQPPMTHADGALYLSRDSDRAKFWRQTQNDWEPGLSTAEKNAVTSYTGETYKRWNKSLRANGQHSSKQSEAADRALKTGIVRDDVMVFRGMNAPAGMEFTPGAYFHDPAFQSTTTNPRAAFEGNTVMRIRVPAGSRGAYVENVSKFPAEKELALPAGGTYLVHSVQIKGGKRYVDVTLTHQGQRIAT